MRSVSEDESNRIKASAFPLLRPAGINASLLCCSLTLCFVFAVERRTTATESRYSSASGGYLLITTDPAPSPEMPQPTPTPASPETPDPELPDSSEVNETGDAEEVEVPESPEVPPAPVSPTPPNSPKLPHKERFQLLPELESAESGVKFSQTNHRHPYENENI